MSEETLVSKGAYNLQIAKEQLQIDASKEASLSTEMCNRKCQNSSKSKKVLYCQYGETSK